MSVGMSLLKSLSLSLAFILFVSRSCIYPLFHLTLAPSLTLSLTFTHTHCFLMLPLEYILYSMLCFHPSVWRIVVEL